MFEMNVNIGDLKIVFGIIRSSSEDANVFLSDGVLTVESKSPIITFSRASIRSCGGIVAIDGDSKFVVSADSVLGILSTGRHHETANIVYDGKNMLNIRICNVAHSVVVETNKDISHSRAIDSCVFVCMQNVNGKDFISVTKSAHDSIAENISVSTTKSVFKFSSNGGEYTSYVEGHSDTVLDYYSGFDPLYLYNLSKFVRSDDELYLMYSGNSPMDIRFELNMWSIDYLVAPIVNND